MLGGPKGDELILTHSLPSLPSSEISHLALKHIKCFLYAKCQTVSSLRVGTIFFTFTLEPSVPRHVAAWQKTDPTEGPH